MSARQRGWAVAAVVVAVVPAAIGLSTYLAGLFLVTATAVAVPLLLREHPKAFARACLALGAGLLAWALIGAVIGMFLFIPAALLLLVAAFADAGNRPGAWSAVATPIAAAAAVALFWLQPPDPENEPPPTFHATLDSTSRFHDRDFNQRKERLRDFGATRIEVAEHHSGQLVLTVGMPDSFAEGQGQDGLKEQILRLPGVVDVRLCTFHTCN